jgi:IS4 transposase
MKKLIFLLCFALGLFAYNNIEISSLKNKISGDVKVVYDYSVDNKNKLIYMIFIYDGDSKTLSKNELENFLKRFKTKMCFYQDLRDKINHGYKLISEYIYKNNVIIRILLDNCK